VSQTLPFAFPPSRAIVTHSLNRFEPRNKAAAMGEAL
jgi:hypothetical protein